MTSLSLNERRQVHLFLKHINDLAVENRGQESNQRLMIKRATT